MLICVGTIAYRWKMANDTKKSVTFDFKVFRERDSL